MGVLDHGGTVCGVTEVGGRFGPMDSETEEERRRRHTADLLTDAADHMYAAAALLEELARRISGGPDPFPS
jgi:hypothetical protein